MHGLKFNSADPWSCLDTTSTGHGISCFIRITCYSRDCEVVHLHFSDNLIYPALWANSCIFRLTWSNLKPIFPIICSVLHKQCHPPVPLQLGIQTKEFNPLLLFPLHQMAWRQIPFALSQEWSSKLYLGTILCSFEWPNSFFPVYPPKKLLKHLLPVTRQTNVGRFRFLLKGLASVIRHDL